MSARTVSREAKRGPYRPHPDIVAAEQHEAHARREEQLAESCRLVGDADDAVDHFAIAAAARAEARRLREGHQAALRRTFRVPA